MRKKLFMAIGLSVVLVAPIFASDTQEVKPSGFMHQHCKMEKENYMQRGDGLLSDLKQLKLSDDQRKQVHLIMQEHMSNMPRTSDAFTDNSFDKAMYIKLEQQKRDNMIENRADMIEKVYNVLNDTQKKELKMMLDKHKNRWMEKK
jgi:Spy/CpxP family protein refolding chaperone